MAEVKDVYGSIYQNLIDAGCDVQTTGQCMKFVKEEKYCDMFPLLSQYRKSLLDSVRTGQRRIDCLDFLIYKIKNYYEKE